MSTTRQQATGLGSDKIDRIVIIFKENHTFDNYFGTFPGANGITLPRSPNPPPRDPDHRHSAWLTRQTTSVRQQFVEADIPSYFAYARKFTLCDQYFTDVAGPSTPNHLMVIAADSPFIDNPQPGDPSRIASSLPLLLDRSKLSWGNYGGYAFQYLSGVGGRNKYSSDQFAKDAASGKLPNVSWVHATSQFDEHPPDPGKGPMGNVTTGMQWTVDQIITWDDWGGWYDHVNPTSIETWKLASPQPSYKGTQFRYGSRVPCLVLGPYAKSGYISKNLHSHVSLVKFCESVFGLPSLNQRDAQADDMSDCFDFTVAPAQPPSQRP
jgi:phospholipase C